MWEFLTHVYDGKDGGMGLLIAFCAACSAVSYVGHAIACAIQGRRIRKPDEDE